MNWRTWAKTKLADHSPLTDKIPAASHFGAGSLQGAPKDKPFLVILIGATNVDLNDGGAPLATSQEAVIWVHDEPGSYDLIDECLPLVREALIGQVAEDTGIACVWQGDSGELADDSYGTIVRNSNYRLVGRT